MASVFAPFNWTRVEAFEGTLLQPYEVFAVVPKIHIEGVLSMESAEENYPKKLLFQSISHSYTHYSFQTITLQTFTFQIVKCL